MKEILFLVVLLFGISTHAETLEIMSYNVENLFDTKHDIEKTKDKKDYTFLPKSDPLKKKGCELENNKRRKNECLKLDWTDKKLDLKLLQLETAIKAERKKLPDMLAVIEVENKNVTEKLAKKLGYKNVEITEGPDERGIDVALLFTESKKIKKISAKELIIPLERATRNILEVEFLIRNKFPLTIFVNHWPSLSNPNESRLKAATILAERILEIKKSRPNMDFLAVGDFNTIPGATPHPFDSILKKDNLLHDLGQSFIEDPLIKQELKDNLPKGSYFYIKKKEWNLLDRIFFSTSLKDKNGPEIDVESYRIHAPRILTREWKIGKRDDPKTFRPFFIPLAYKHNEERMSEAGFSDHFALYVEIKYPASK